MASYKPSDALSTKHDRDNFEVIAFLLSLHLPHPDLGPGCGCRVSFDLRRASVETFFFVFVKVEAKNDIQTIMKIR